MPESGDDDEAIGFANFVYDSVRTMKPLPNRRDGEFRDNPARQRMTHNDFRLINQSEPEPLSGGRATTPDIVDNLPQITQRLLREL